MNPSARERIVPDLLEEVVERTILFLASNTSRWSEVRVRRLKGYAAPEMLSL
jgi:hypothetical protein